MAWVVKIERCRCRSCGWSQTRQRPKTCPECSAEAVVAEERWVRYRASYRDPSGNVRSRNFRRKEDAKSFLNKTETTINEKTYRDPDEGKVRFGDYFEKLLATDDLAPSTRLLYRTEYRLHVEPAFGRVELRAITPKAIREHLGSLRSRGVGDRTRQSVRGVISRTLSQAVDDGILATNPAAFRTKRNTARGTMRRKVRVLRPEEVEAIAEAIDPRYRALVLTAAYGALRFGEAAGLRKRDLKLLERKLHIEGSVVQVGGRVERVDETKTEGSLRHVSIPASIAEELARHLTTYRVASDDGLVFTAPGGGPLSRTVFRNRVWLQAAREAGIDPRPRFHDLRHTGVAMAIAAGAHPKTIQSWVGHSSIKTTMDVYGHLYDEAEEELAARLDELRIGAVTPGRKVMEVVSR